MDGVTWMDGVATWALCGYGKRIVHMDYAMKIPLAPSHFVFVRVMGMGEWLSGGAGCVG